MDKALTPIDLIRIYPDKFKKVRLFLVDYNIYQLVELFRRTRIQGLRRN